MAKIENINGFNDNEQTEKKGLMAKTKEKISNALNKEIVITPMGVIKTAGKVLGIIAGGVLGALTIHALAGGDNSEDIPVLDATLTGDPITGTFSATPDDNVIFTVDPVESTEDVTATTDATTD